MSGGYEKGSLLVVLSGSATAQNNNDLVTAVLAFGGQVDRELEAMGIFLVTFTPGQEADWKDWLETQPGVEVVEYNHWVSIC